ncbi:ABC transporter substrate-binding protein [Streptomyces bauhiniae]|uniref:ABC transporter substrate-binding protein n=1 Tax=Streptomyces bauhiniae TaxID=2340725 RepID=UPI0035D735FB
MKKRILWPGMLMCMGLIVGMLSSCGGVLGVDRGPSMVVGMSEEILATDPASGYDPGSWMIFNNVFQSLLTFPPGATDPEPDAAERCSFTDEDARIYKCILKDDLHFSNGDPLTVDDVKFSFDRMLDIDDAAGPAVMFKSLKKVEVPDDSTVIFRLKSPDATFPSKIASGAGSIVDHRQYSRSSLRTDGEAVGSGPYTLQDIDTKRAVFAVNDKYRGAAEVENSGVTLRFFHGNQKALKQALLEGSVDIAYRGLSERDIADIEVQSKKRGIEVVEGNSAEIQHLVFNMKDPAAGNLAVRKAMAYLVDRQALIQDVYRDTAIPLYSTIPTGIAGHTTAFFDMYGPNPSRVKAEEVLRAAGITKKVKLTLWSTPTRYGPATDEELAAIAKQLDASGLFDAHMKSVAFEQYEKDVAAGRYGVYVKGWVPDYPDADNFTSPFFGPGNVLKNSYENKKITGTLLPRTAVESDRLDTQADFGELQEIVAQDVPILPIWQAKQYAVIRDGVHHGVEYCLDESTVFRFWRLSKD